MPSKKSHKTETDLKQFEKKLAEIESIVHKMEQGKLSLEDALHNFERGIKLTRECQLSLSQAEQKIEILLQQHGTQILKDFDDETHDE